MKKCSIIIPTHNRPSLLIRAVHSALLARPESCDIIVVDDGSSILASNVLVGPAFDNVRIIRNEVSLGGGGSCARNKGAMASSGEVIFFLDDDDEILPHYFKDVMASAVAKNAEFGFCARKFCVSSRNDRERYKIEKAVLPSGFVPLDAKFSDYTFPFSAGFWISRSAYDYVGPFSEILSTNSDTEYSCRLYSSGLRGWFFSKPGVLIHKHNSQSQNEANNVTKRIKSEDRALAFKSMTMLQHEFLKHNASAAEFVYGRLIKHSIRAKMYSDAYNALNSVPYKSVKFKLLFLFLAHRIVSIFK